MGKHADSVDQHVLRRIVAKGEGWVFSPSDFQDLGSRTAVDLALMRLPHPHRWPFSPRQNGEAGDRPPSHDAAQPGYGRDHEWLGHSDGAVAGPWPLDDQPCAVLAMFFGAAPTFDELMRVVGDFERAFNGGTAT